MRVESVLRQWIPIVFVITVLCLFIDVAVQQNYRLSANDPQIQIAEDDATLLNQKVEPETIVGNMTVDLSKSLAPFVIIYDSDGKVVTSSARLNDTTPVLPQGVLQTARFQGENQITWQPAIGVREAIAVVTYPQGYVVVGRSLKEVEMRENRLNLIAVLAWLTAVGGSFILITFLTLTGSKKK